MDRQSLREGLGSVGQADVLERARAPLGRQMSLRGLGVTGQIDRQTS